MGSLSVWHWLLFLAVALLMFGGKGKISSIMGDVAEGIKSFEFDPRDPGRLLVSWKRLDRDALDIAVWRGGQLATVDTYVLPGSARFLAGSSTRVAYVVVQERRAGVYVADLNNATAPP